MNVWCECMFILLLICTKYVFAHCMKAMSISVVYVHAVFWGGIKEATKTIQAERFWIYIYDNGMFLFQDYYLWNNQIVVWFLSVNDKWWKLFFFYIDKAKPPHKICLGWNIS